MTRTAPLALVALWTLPALALGAEAADVRARIAERFERLSLAERPTPLQEMRALRSAIGGPRLFVKRDDLTGLAFGGNKTRKLDFILADALAKKADVLVTGGGTQSNWARQAAAAARRYGLRCVLVLSKSEERPVVWDGNLLLDRIFGAEIHLVEPDADRMAVMESLAREERARGHRPYVVDVGGSAPGGDMTIPLGAIAYADGFAELYEQAQALGVRPTHVVVATGGGGTQAGLLVGARAVDPAVEVIGIMVSRNKAESAENIAAIATETARALELDLPFEPTDIVLLDDYLGEGYGIVYPGVVDAIARVARTEAILLDPVYTGKAMAGLVDLVAKGRFDENDVVVFVHTGGTPALFPYREEILKHLDAPRPR